MRDTIVVGQRWKGSAVAGFAIVEIVEIGNQPKRRKITVKQIQGMSTPGYVYTLNESELRSDFSLQKAAPAKP